MLLASVGYLGKTVRGTRRDAEREVARVVVEVDEGRHVAAAPIEFGELLDRWLDVKRRTVEASTLSSDEWIARSYVRSAQGRVAAADRSRRALLGPPRPIDLDALYSGLRGRGLSPRTVRICHTVMRQSLEQARRWGLIARNPAMKAMPPPQHRREVDPPTVAQVQQLIDAAREDDPDFATYLWALAATGCRRGEACALRWTDVDLERGELVIGRSMSQVVGELREKDTKTRQSRRMAIDEGTVDVLRTHRLRRREVALALGVSLSDDALLFSDVENPEIPSARGLWSLINVH
jgi:integrase